MIDTNKFCFFLFLSLANFYDYLSREEYQYVIYGNGSTKDNEGNCKKKFFGW